MLFKKIIIGLVGLSLSIPFFTFAQTAIVRNEQNINPFVDSTYYLGTTTPSTKAWLGVITDTLTVTGINTSGATRCVQITSAGVVQTASAACGSGGGGGSDVNWTYVSNGNSNDGLLYLSTTTNQVVIGATATTSKASLEILQVLTGGGSLLVNSSTTLQNFTFINATGTSATTTNFNTTNASTTNFWTSLGNTLYSLSAAGKGQATTVSSPLSFTGSTLSISTAGAWSGTAGSLAANGANCSAGNAPLGVDALGAVESCFDVWTEAENTSAAYAAQATTITIAGTPFQITSSAGAQDLSGNRTWTNSIPTDFRISSTTLSNILVSNGSILNTATATAATTTNLFATTASTSKLFVGTGSGVLTSTNGLVGVGVNGTDYTLITALTCSGSDKISAVTAAGVFTCTEDATAAGGTLVPTKWATSTSAFLSITPNGGNNVGVGIGTSTPPWALQIASSTAAQLALSDGSLTSNHWVFRNITNTLYIATSSPLTYATSTVAALAINTNGIPSFPALGGATGCAQFSSAGTLSNTGTACGTGSGGGSTFWATTTLGSMLNNIYPNGSANTTLSIGTSTPALSVLTVASSTNPQITFTDNANTPAYFWRDISGNAFFGTSSPTTYATSTDNFFEFNGNTGATLPGIKVGKDGNTATFDIFSSSSTIPNLVTGNISIDNPGVFSFLDMVQLGAAANTPEAATIGFSSVNATNTLTIWGLATGAANAIKNFAVSIGTSTQPSAPSQAVGETHLQIASDGATSTVSLMSTGVKGGRIILKDTSGGTCTEITTQGGTVNGKAVTCPSN